MHTSKSLPGYLFPVVIGFMLGSLAGGPAVWSAPQGGTIEGGEASILQDDTTTTIIRQQSGRAIGKFDSFNVWEDERVELRQPGPGAIFWAKDHQNKPSKIHGRIQGNGQFWLSNRNGILVGPTGRIDTAGTVLTSSFMRNERFLSGSNTFDFDQPGNPDAAVINEGHISAGAAGLVGLVAPGVVNDGIIQAWLGTVALASANRFTLDPQGDGVVRIAVDDQILDQVIDHRTGKPLRHLVSNHGTLEAFGGRVALSAAETRLALDSVIDSSGEILAPTVEKQIGTITFSTAFPGQRETSGTTSRRQQPRTPRQKITVAGKLDVSGKEKDQSGGDIYLLGEEVELAKVDIDASGHAGGGQVFVGGDFMGGHGSPEQTQRHGLRSPPRPLPTAQYSILEHVEINADATHSGRAGQIIISADKNTLGMGRLSARGEQGLIAISGQEYLADGFMIDVGNPSAEKGGTLLYDSGDIRVTNAGARVDFDNPYEPLTDTIIASGSIESVLNVGGDVSLVADQVSDPGSGPSGGNIAIEADIVKRDGGDSTLSLYAGGGVDIGSGVWIVSPPWLASGGLQIYAATNDDYGFFRVGTRSLIDTNGGDLAVQTGLFSTAGAIFTNGGNIHIEDNSANNFGTFEIHPGGLLATNGGDLAVQTGLFSIAGAIFTNGENIRIEDNPTNDAGAFEIRPEGRIDTGSGEMTVRTDDLWIEGTILTQGGDIRLEDNSTNNDAGFFQISPEGWIETGGGEMTVRTDDLWIEGTILTQGGDIRMEDNPTKDFGFFQIGTGGLIRTGGGEMTVRTDDLWIEGTILTQGGDIRIEDNPTKDFGFFQIGTEGRIDTGSGEMTVRTDDLWIEGTILTQGGDIRMEDNPTKDFGFFQIGTEGRIDTGSGEMTVRTDDLWIEGEIHTWGGDIRMEDNPTNNAGFFQIGTEGRIRTGGGDVTVRTDDLLIEGEIHTWGGDIRIEDNPTNDAGFFQIGTGGQIWTSGGDVTVRTEGYLIEGVVVTGGGDIRIEDNPANADNLASEIKSDDWGSLDAGSGDITLTEDTRLGLYDHAVRADGNIAITASIIDFGGEIDTPQIIAASEDKVMISGTTASDPFILISGQQPAFLGGIVSEPVPDQYAVAGENFSAYTTPMLQFWMAGSGGPGSPPGEAALGELMLTVSGLPAGVSYANNGNGTVTLSGTPTQSGSFTIRVVANVSGGNVAVSEFTQEFTMFVAPPPTSPSAETTQSSSSPSATGTTQTSLSPSAGATQPAASPAVTGVVAQPSSSPSAGATQPAVSPTVGGATQPASSPLAGATQPAASPAAAGAAQASSHHQSELPNLPLVDPSIAGGKSRNHTVVGPKPGGKAKPSTHAWQYLYSYGGEEPGYATYSYVLVGRGEANEKATSLYYELVKAIHGSTISATSLGGVGGGHVSKNRLNLFLIPIGKPDGFEYNKPNYELSKLLLTALSVELPLDLSRPGPYIITLYQPISAANTGNTADVLYVDLSGVHAKAIPEIVRTYKGIVMEEEITGIEKLKSLRLSLLSIALLAQDAIGFAKTAYGHLAK